MSDNSTIKGTVHKIMATVNVSEKFSKKEIVIKTEGDYPQYIPIQFTNKNIDKLDHTTIGSTVIVSYNLRGRMWVAPSLEEKCFATIEGWQIKVENQVFNSSIQIEKVEEKQNIELPQTEIDDLPF